MVDKPTGKTEILIDDIIGWIKAKIDYLKDKTSPQREAWEKANRRHPRIMKTLVVLACILLFGGIVVGFATPKTVKVTINDSNVIETKVYETTCVRVDSFIKDHEVDYVYGQDIIDVDMYDIITNNKEINIIKAAQIPLTADGVTRTITTQPITVKEFLEKQHVKVGKHDIVEPDMDYVLYKGDQVIVRRVTFKNIVEDVQIDFETVYSPDYGLNIGDTAVVQEGSPGKEKQKFKVTYIDGVESEREIIDRKTLVEKQDNIISYGMYMDFSEPTWLSYSKKISNMKAVSYNMPGNPKGSYGNPCTYGTCAVDPSVIPLGSTVYIEGYGYALANDVGSAIKGNIIDVYMEYNPQCYIWGGRNVDVYIVG